MRSVRVYGVETLDGSIVLELLWDLERNHHRTRLQGSLIYRETAVNSRAPCFLRKLYAPIRLAMLLRATDTLLDKLGVLL
jgi:hypothetical protein